MKVSYVFVLHIILLPILIFFHTRGIVTHDEGYIIYSAEKVLNGLVVYRDFDFVYTPFSIFLTSLSFKLLGTTVLSSRILMIILSIASSFLIYKTVILATRNKFYATLAVSIFIAWGPNHLNFAWPVMFSIPASLVVCYLLLKFLETRLQKYLFLTGLAAFGVFLTKQNFGFAIILPILVFFLTKSSRRISYAYYNTLGYLWGIILFISYLLITSSLKDFIHNMYFYTFEWILVNKSLTTPFLYPDVPLKMMLRTTLYLFVPFISLATFTLLYIRRRFHLLFLPTFIFVFYMFGIRPTTDYVHLVPLLSLVGIPIGLCLRYNISSYIRLFLITFSFVLILSGFYSALYRGYYRWDTPLINHSHYFNGKVNLFLNAKFYNEFKEFEELAINNNLKQKYIYVDSFNPLFYFLLDAKEPMKKGYLGSGINNEEYYHEVVANLVGKEIPMVVLSHNHINNHKIKTFILNHYNFHKTIQDFDIYLRKP